MLAAMSIVLFEECGGEEAQYGNDLLRNRAWVETND
jgi:hypothetical protein